MSYDRNGSRAAPRHHINLAAAFGREAAIFSPRNDEFKGPQSARSGRPERSNNGPRLLLDQLNITMAGALAGYYLVTFSFYMSVALGAGIGGAAVGFLIAVAIGYSHPTFFTIATAIGAIVISLLNARLTTIIWTSAAGAAVATLGILEFPLELSGSTEIGFLAIYALLFSGAWVFQLRTTRREFANEIVSDMEFSASRRIPMESVTSS